MSVPDIKPNSKTFMLSENRSKTESTMSQSVNAYNKVMQDLSLLAAQVGKMFQPGDVYPAVISGKIKNIANQVEANAAKLTAAPSSDNVMTMRPGH